MKWKVLSLGSIVITIAAGLALSTLLLSSHAYDDEPPFPMKTLPAEHIPFSGVTVTGVRVTDHPTITRDEALQIVAERSNREPGDGVREIKLVAFSGADPNSGEYIRTLRWWISLDSMPVEFMEGGGSHEPVTPTPDPRPPCRPDQWAFVMEMNASNGDIGARFGWADPACRLPEATPSAR